MAIRLVTKQPGFVGIEQLKTLILSHFHGFLLWSKLWSKTCFLPFYDIYAIFSKNEKIPKPKCIKGFRICFTSALEGTRTPDLLVRSRGKWRSVYVKMRQITAIVNPRFSTKISMLSTLVKPLPISIVVIIVVIPEPYGHRLFLALFFVALWS